MRFNEVICWVVLSLAILSCDAIIPDAAIELFSASNTDLSAPTLSVFASTALFGPRLDFRNPAPHDGSNLMPLILPPDDNALLCNEPPSNATSSLSDSILLIPKGGCTYKRKVYHAQLLGAQHAIILETWRDMATSVMTSSCVMYCQMVQYLLIAKVTLFSEIPPW